jgi:DNA-binding MarR family transcriptional regulator
VEEFDADFTSAISRLYRRLRAQKGNDEVSDSHFSALKLLVDEGPRTLRELSDHEHVKPPSMNQTVNYLESSGYVVRRDDPNDGRKVILEATAKGGDLVDATRRRRHEWLDSQLAHLSHEERRVLSAAAAIIARITDS